MGFVLREQMLAFLCSIFLGVVVGLVYDVLRSGRIHWRLGVFFTAILDFFFFIFFIAVCFVFWITIAGGELRFYTILGLGMGISLYFLSISSFIMAGLGFLLHLFSAIFGKMWTIFANFRKKIKKLSKNAFHFLKNVVSLK